MNSTRQKPEFVMFGVLAGQTLGQSSEAAMSSGVMKFGQPLRNMALGIVVGAALFAATTVQADVVVSAAQTMNMNCSGGVCAPTGKEAILNVGDLEGLLASGNVQVTTTGSNVQADNIKIDAPLTWSSIDTLTLDAHGSVVVLRSVTVAGSGGIAIATGNVQGPGAFKFGPDVNVSFENLASSLVINGASYILTNSLTTLANAVLANSSDNVALANSYDASQDGVYVSSPINAQLEGTIEGLGNAISNLSIDARLKRGVKHPFAAFVGSVGSTGVVENLRLNQIKYKGAAGSGLTLQNFGSLFDDHVSGSIDSRGDPAGGLVGGNSGIISSSSTNVRIRVGCCKSGGGIAGGLVVSNAGTIVRSHADGDVVAPVAGAGLANINSGVISESYATGNINWGGGLVAQAEGSIENSYATGAVGGDNSGGLIQSIVGTTTTISYSYATGSVSSQGESGGFVCGSIYGDFVDDYWDTTTSGTDYGVCNDNNTAGVTGLTSNQMIAALPSGFNPKIWAEHHNINGGLPYLINNPPEKKYK